MRIIYLLAIAVGLSAFSKTDSEHFLKDEQPSNRASAKAQNGAVNLVASEYLRCDLDQKDWGSVDGLHFVTALIERTMHGFKSASPRTKNPVCAILSVDSQGKVKGKLECRRSMKDIAQYSIVPGALIGRGPGNFLMIPNSDPTKPPLWAPANCKLQFAKPQLAIVEPRGRNEIVALSIGEDEEEPEIGPVMKEGD